MIAPVPLPPHRARGWCTRSALRIVVWLLTACGAVPADAEIGATVSIFSDARFRGYSLSGNQPVGTFDFAYDDRSGLYAGGAITGVVRSGGDLEPLGFGLNAGFAKRLRSGTSFDVGVTTSSYTYYSQGGPRKTYAEVYAGIARGGLSSRIFLSPHYSEAGIWTAYGEVNGNISPAPDWNIEGHAGMLVPLRAPSEAERYRSAFDWRAGVSRRVGRVSLHAAWVQGARGGNYYGSRWQKTHAFVLGASFGL